MKDFNFEVWRMQAQSDTKGLIAMLKDSNSATRRAAATALRAMGSPSAIYGVQDALLQETEPEIRELLVVTLETLFANNNEANPNATNGNRNIVRLIERLSGAHTEQAIRAAQELGDSREKLTVEALLMTFNNKKMSPRVRLAVAEALLKLQSAPAEITLLAALRSERWMVRRNAAAVLGQLGCDWAVEPLIKALHDPIEGVRRVARAALERIDTAEARAAFEAPALPAEGETIGLTLDKPVGTELITPIPSVSPTPSTQSITGNADNSAEDGKVDGQDGSTSNPIRAAAILDEPPPSEEDTKPIRPVPDDVS